MLESTIVKEIMDYLRIMDKCFVWKNHGGQFARIGLPDIIAILDGHAYAFEVKRPGNTPTKLQQATLRKLRNAGATAEVVYSLEDVIQLIIKA